MKNTKKKKVFIRKHVEFPLSAENILHICCWQVWNLCIKSCNRVTDPKVAGEILPAILSSAIILHKNKQLIPLSYISEVHLLSSIKVVTYSE